MIHLVSEINRFLMTRWPNQNRPFSTKAELQWTISNFLKLFQTGRHYLMISSLYPRDLIEWHWGRLLWNQLLLLKPPLHKHFNSSTDASAFPVVGNSCRIWMSDFPNRKVLTNSDATSPNACLAVFFSVLMHCAKTGASCLLVPFVLGDLFEVLAGNFCRNRMKTSLKVVSELIPEFARSQWLHLSGGFWSSVIYFFPLTCVGEGVGGWATGVKLQWNYRLTLKIWLLGHVPFLSVLHDA